jgi:hypothetical protein
VQDDLPDERRLKPLNVPDLAPAGMPALAQGRSPRTEDVIPTRSIC